MTYLELLAPARNADIGIAAIDCGADAVYIAGPAFGARKDAGNPVTDIARLCEYAHRFGARIFVTVNTIIFDGELRDCYRLMLECQKAGADALIVQDPALLSLAAGGPDGRGEHVSIPLHASTQCAIRTPERARALAEAGFSRVVLERQLSLEQIRRISSATDAEIEAFVHGALCVSYSGECYLSEKLAGRSANRGACIQACRGRYDLSDDKGNVLARNKAFLSLKDFNLLGKMLPLAEAGVTSFKIEGRLKSASYVKNVVKAYSDALDQIVRTHPGKYARASFGRTEGCSFTPDLDKTFNRGYTELFIDGRRGNWAASDAPKSMGERIGEVISVKPAGRNTVEVSVSSKSRLSNGDGFAFVSGEGITGFRGDICRGSTIICKRIDGLTPGTVLFRNISSEFEKILASDGSRRIIDVKTVPSISGSAEKGYTLEARLTSSDGRALSYSEDLGQLPEAQNRSRMLSMLEAQLSKSSEHYSFHVAMEGDFPDIIPLIGAARLNAFRRNAAAALDRLPCNRIPLGNSRLNPAGAGFTRPEEGYKANVANHISEGMFGPGEKAYELTHRRGAELMRSKYCIRYELGYCPKEKGHSKPQGKWFLSGNGQPLELVFDCARCEMAVIG